MPTGGIYLNLTWANDGLNYFVPAVDQAHGRVFHDDNGFTNDLSACAGYMEDQEQWGLCFLNRMITERGGLSRSDHALGEGNFQSKRDLGNSLWETGFLGLGMVATGPLGGAPFQDSFHGLIRWGRRLDGEGRDQLQNHYEGGVRIGPRLRVGGRLDCHKFKRAILSAGAEAAISPGVGASYGQLDLGAQHFWQVGKGQFDLFGQVSFRHLRSEEARLSFKGGYPQDSTFFQPRMGLSYHLSAQTLSFSLILNVEGTGSHQGVLSFTQGFNL